MANDSRDWGDGLFVIVYGTLARDHPTVYRNAALLGGYVQCLMVARGMRGAPFEAPRMTPDEVVAALIADDVLDVVGDGLYLFHGLDRETEGVEARGAAGGRARAKNAPRVAGRFAGGFAGDSRSDAGPSLVAVAGGDAGNGTADHQQTPATRTSDSPAKYAGENAGHQRTSQERRVDESRGGATTSRAPSTVDTGGTRAPDPAGIGQTRAEVGGGRFGAAYVASCQDAETHRTQWRYVGGVGWKCLVCDAEKPGDRSFREKVRDHGADV